MTTSNSRSKGEEVIDIINTRPAITQCTGSVIDDEICSQFGFPIGQTNYFSELSDINLTGPAWSISSQLSCSLNVYKLEGI